MASPESLARAAQSFFARWPRVVELALARMRLSRKAEYVLRQVGLSLFGVDERYRLVGVPVSERVIAAYLNRAPSGVHAGIAELLAGGILVRRPDRERRHAWRYQIAHPVHWNYADGVPPAGLHTLPPDDVEGWPVPLLRFARMSRGPCDADVVHEVVHTPAGGAHPAVSTHSRAFVGVEEDPRSVEISLVDRYWIDIRGRRASLVEVVGATLDERFPGWETFGVLRAEDVPASVVGSLVRELPSGRGSWTPLIVRHAVVRAAELAATLAADRDDLARVAMAREAADIARRAGVLVRRWDELVGTGVVDAEADAAVARVAAGNGSELDVAEALVDTAEANAWAAESDELVDAREDDVAEAGQDSGPAAPVPAPPTDAGLSPEPDVPVVGLRRPRGGPVASISPEPPPVEVRQRAIELLAALDRWLVGDDTSDAETDVLIARTSRDLLRSQLDAADDRRLLALAVQQGERVVVRLRLDAGVVDNDAESLTTGQPLAGIGDRPMEASFECLSRRQDRQVLGDVDAAAVQLKELDLLALLPGAKNDPQRGRLAGFLLMSGEPSEVELHLPLMLGAEVAELQVDRNESPQLPVVEQEVDVEVVVVDQDALLSSDEGESGAELQQELLDVAEDRVFEVLLQVAIVEPEEIEEVGVLEEERWRDLPRLAQLGEVMPDRLVGLFGDCGALVEHRPHPLLELPGGPPFEPAELGVEVALQRVVDVNERLDVGPAQFSPQRGENLLVGNCLRGAETMSELLHAPASTVRGGELPGQRLDDLLAVGGPFPTEHFGADPAADLPVEQGQFGVDRRGDARTGAVDESLNIREEPVIGNGGWDHSGETPGGLGHLFDEPDVRPVVRTLPPGLRAHRTGPLRSGLGRPQQEAGDGVGVLPGLRTPRGSATARAHEQPPAGSDPAGSAALSDLRADRLLVMLMNRAAEGRQESRERPTKSGRRHSIAGEGLGGLVSLWVAAHSPPAMALSCDDLRVLLDAGTPVPLISETVRASAPLPTAADLTCLRAHGTSASTVEAIAAAAGLEWAEEPAPGSTATASVAPPKGPAAPLVRVFGMDAEHTAEAVGASAVFTGKVTLYRGRACPALQTADFAIDVIYDSTNQRTRVKVTTTGFRSPPLRPYPGGRSLNVGCTGVLAAAACMTWGVSDVTVLHKLAGADLVLGMTCDARGAIPFAMGVVLAGRAFDVPIYHPSYAEVLLVYPGKLPDGTLNGTARIAGVVGEENYPP